jgi:hypothetical protein
MAHLHMLPIAVSHQQEHQHQLHCTALQELDAVVKEAAHTHSAAAKGKLHYFLQEGRLTAAAPAQHQA